MNYVMSDIHGCYIEYLKALEEIEFQDFDNLYVLGDCVDRGYASIQLLQDMMMRPNVFPIMGNHDLEARIILRQICGVAVGHKKDDIFQDNFIEIMNDWVKDGGQTTLDEFCRLSGEEQQCVLEYLEEFSLYEEIETAGKTYLLIHGGLEPFVPEKKVEDYDILHLLLSHPDYDRRYYSEKYTITGHTPTITQMGNTGTIIRRNNHIAIDCGCVYGYNLAVFCMETGREFYIPFQGCYKVKIF